MPIYVGVNGVARKVKQAYIGVNGTAVPIYNSGDVLLPSGYVPVEYVYGNQNGGMPIGIKPGPYTRICLCCYIGPSTSKQYLIDNAGSNFDIHLTNSKGIKVYWCNTGISDISFSNLSMSDWDKTLLDINFNTNRYSGIKRGIGSWKTLTSHTGNETSNSQLYLYYENSIRIYYCKIIKDLYNPTNGETRELYPVHQISTGYNGLYDIINNKFYGEGTASAGPNIQNYNIPSFAH